MILPDEAYTMNLGGRVVLAILCVVAGSLVAGMMFYLAHDILFGEFLKKVGWHQ